MYSDGGGKPKLKLSSIAAINQVTKSRDLVDVWRLRHPEQKRFTFRQPKPLIQRLPDFFLISNSMQDNVRSVDILPALNTDHSTIYLRSQIISSKNKGSSHWKFNNSLLNNPEFVSQMREKIPNFVSEFSNTSESLDPSVKREFLKYKMKVFSKQFSIQLKCVRESSKKLKELGDSLKPDCPENIVEEYEDCKAKLDCIYDYISKGAILRSRIDWYEKDEKATKFFLNLEKQNKAKTHVQLLIDDDGEYNDPDIILNQLKLFMKIYTLDVHVKLS